MPRYKKHWARSNFWFFSARLPKKVNFAWNIQLGINVTALWLKYSQLWDVQKRSKDLIYTLLVKTEYRANWTVIKFIFFFNNVTEILLISRWGQIFYI